MLKDNEQRFFDALKHDLGRPTLETELYVSRSRCPEAFPTHMTSSLDFSATYQDVHDAYNSVEKWATPYKADFNLSFWAMSPKIRPEPKGLILIIAPFNGPIIMLISPLVSAYCLQIRNDRLIFWLGRRDCCRKCCNPQAV